MAERLSTDILISGAGPAGTVAAMFLAKAGISSLLVDKAVFPRDKICGDALSGKVSEVVRKLDPSILDRLEAEPTQLGSFGVTFVAPNLNSLRVPFKKDYVTTERAPGYIIKRFDFDDFMLNEALSYDQIKFRDNTDLKHFERVGDQWKVSTADKDVEIDCKIIIAADGAHSVFARHTAGLKVEKSHHCAGLRAYYKNVGGLDQDNFIELHFLKDFLPGYFWIFPLPDGMANVGVGMRSDKVSEKGVNLKNRMLELIETSPKLRERFANAELIGDIKGFGLPLGSKKRSISGDGFMLTGDAGSLIDPFTGEGIGNAMMSAMFAAQTAAMALENGSWNSQTLRTYDDLVYDRLWSELNLSYKMQQLVNYPWLFNFVVNKAKRSKTLSETISCMFEDVDLRKKLSSPSFYFNLIFN